MRKDKRRRDIKSKLIAAICMLLVSSIMMVSTTYAWFTLSTAPEVTGINTSVGANGALEMALLPATGINDHIRTGVGTSASASTAVAANTAWGNLVDLSDASYGLNNISLMPAALKLNNATSLVTGDNMTSTDDLFLRTPTYGADGRVDTLENTLVNGASTAQGATRFLVPQATTGENATDTSIFGVRGVGTASAMTPRQQNFRGFRASASGAMSAAKSSAQTSLSANGQAIANMAVSYALGSNEFLQSDMDALQAIVTACTSSVNNIKTSITDYVKAAMISGQYGLSDVEAEIVVSLFDEHGDIFTLMSASAPADETKANLLNTVKTKIGEMDSYTAMKNAFDAMNTQISNAQGAINNAKTIEGKDTYSWATMSGVLSYIANPTSMTVNGMTMDEIRADKNALVNDVIANNMQVDVEVPSGSGIFADIADFAGDYKAPIKVHITYTGLDADVNATMATKTSLPTSYLPALNALVATLPAPEASTSGDTAITDLYGYVIDLAFRTNAASGTKLQLQGPAIDRIYSDNKNMEADTMGGGSNMTFTGALGFGETNMVALMENINVVFFDTKTGDIYGMAKLDVGTTTTGEGESAVVTKNYTYNATSNEIKANLIMMNWAPVVDAEQNLDPYGNLTFNGKADSQAIATLNQNEIKNISVLVYLDGNTVENADVANAASSMTGTLNLQFSTDTPLTPMEYTPLMEQSGETTAPSEPATSESTEPTT